MAQITIRGNQLSLTDSRLGSSSAEHILLKWKQEDVSSVQKSLSELKIEVQQNLGDQVWLCHYPGKDLSKFKNLGGFLFAVVYHPDFKTQNTLKLINGNCDVSVVLHADAQSAFEKTKADIEKLVPSPSIIISANGILKLSLDAKLLKDIAAREEVKAIELLPRVGPSNDHATTIVKIKEMNASRLADGTLTGDGQLIAISDTGIDRSHFAFQDSIQREQDLANRIKRNNDFDGAGHGTHTAATIVGHFGPDKWPSALALPLGAATKAKLIVQTIFTRKTLVPQLPEADTQVIMDTPLGTGANIHNNSWVAAVDRKNPRQYPYQDSDAGVLDKVAYANPSYLLVFAAGNDGDITSLKAQIGSYSAAKNILTVGASVSDREVKLESYLRPGDLTEHTGNTGANGRPVIDYIANFSSVGPTVEKRRKPDVVAPGTAIVSAGSSGMSDETIQKYKDLFGSIKETQKGRPWLLLSGTSMATPVVSGCAALLREALEKKFKLAPSAITSALIKALIINGAKDISRDQSGPNNEQGFGRVDMESSIRPLLSSTDQRFRFGVTKDMTERPPDIDIKAASPLQDDGPFNFKVTLVYIDSPGAALQDEINLKVVVVGGETKIDNAENNVHQIVVKNIKKNDKIKVSFPRDEFTPRTRENHWAVVWDFYA